MPTKHEKYMKDREGIGATKVKLACIMARNSYDFPNSFNMIGQLTRKIKRLQLI